MKSGGNVCDGPKRSRQVEIEDEHEGPFHELVGRDLDSRVPVDYPEATVGRSIGHRTSPFTGRVQRGLRRIPAARSRTS